MWNDEVESQCTDITLMLLAAGGWGMLDFGVAVAVGLKVMISPLWRPSASCFPFGDQETAGN